jgi:hypothetical protein
MNTQKPLLERQAGIEGREPTTNCPCLAREINPIFRRRTAKSVPDMQAYKANVPERDKTLTRPSTFPNAMLSDML